MNTPDGGILTDGAIIEAMRKRNIVIEPFKESDLGSNSYDVHLGRTLAVYGELDWDPGKYPGRQIPVVTLDARKKNPITFFDIPDTGYTLQPGVLYLGATVEYTETRDVVPWIDGKSSVGRLGIRVHATAGRGDIGFCNHWTLEIDVVMPVIIEAGMPIGQLTYFTKHGDVLTPYDKKRSAKYMGRNPKPVPSYMWKNFLPLEPECICIAGEKLDEHCPKHKVA